MKVVAFNGSPREGGNTEILLQAVLTPIKAAGIEAELVQIGGQALRGCVACMHCRTKHPGRCGITNDQMNSYIEKMREADGILLGSPTYFADVTSEMKALIDRGGYVTRGHNAELKRKIGAAVVAVRRGGATHAFDTMNHFFQISQMIIPGSTYWNMGYGLHPGDVLGDSEALKNMQDLGETMAWLLKTTR